MIPAKERAWHKALTMVQSTFRAMLIARGGRIVFPWTETACSISGCTAYTIEFMFGRSSEYMALKIIWPTKPERCTDERPEVQIIGGRNFEAFLGGVPFRVHRACISIGDDFCISVSDLTPEKAAEAVAMIVDPGATSRLAKRAEAMVESVQRLAWGA